MTPLELLARLAALVPPPRYPLTRFHGVLAPHAAWRREIVPRPPTIPKHRTDTARHNEAKVGSSNGIRRIIDSRQRRNRARRNVERVHESVTPALRTAPRRTESAATSTRTDGAPRVIRCCRASSNAGYGRSRPQGSVGRRRDARAQYLERSSLVSAARRTSLRHLTARAMARAPSENILMIASKSSTMPSSRTSDCVSTATRSLRSRSLLPLKSTVSPARAPSISSKMGAIVEIPMISWPWHANLAVETAMMR